MNAVFPTTVTNAGPTAKQSRCLHPDVRLSFVRTSFRLIIYQSHRMLTIREFARSQGFPDCFEFVSLKDKVITVCIFFSVLCDLSLSSVLCRYKGKLAMQYLFH